MNTSLRPAIVLVECLDPINLGSVVRVCRNCDLDDLRLVRPRVFDVERMTITAPHSADWIAEHCRVFDTFDEAVGDLQRLYAFTARSREQRTRFVRLGEALDEAESHAPAQRTAFVFGREDVGLPNRITERCTAAVQIETSEQYPSINLAQAVLLASHAAFVRNTGAHRALPPDQVRALAPAGQVGRLLDMLERHLDAIDFYKGTQRDNVNATLRRIASRAELDPQELATLFGIVRESHRAVERSEGSPQRAEREKLDGHAT